MCCCLILDTLSRVIVCCSLIPDSLHPMPQNRLREIQLLLNVLWLCISSDASPAYWDGTCGYDADASVALDAGDLIAFDFDNESDVRS